jgi:hypothetical protein
MNLDTIDDIYEALSTLEAINHANKQLAYKCAQRAKALKELDLEFEARFIFLRQLYLLNEYDEAIAIFPWFLKLCDKYPERFNYFDVLWAFKWIIGAVNYYHKINLTQINNLFDEFEKRFKSYGSGDKVIDYFKMRLYAETGRTKESLVAYRQYQKNDNAGELDDCDACQPNNCQEVLLLARKYDKVLELTKFILDNKLKCHNVPATVYPHAVYAAMMLGDAQTAEYYLQLALKKLKLKVEAHLFHAHSLLLFCAVTKNELKGRSIVEKQLPFSFSTMANYNLFFFYFACCLFIKSLSQAELKLTLNIDGNNFVKPLKQNVYSVPELEEWFNVKAIENGKLLDQRNGNDFFLKHYAFMCKRLAKVLK